MQTIGDIRHDNTSELTKLYTYAARSINQMGDGQHPAASGDTVGWFALDYAAECIQKCLDRGLVPDNLVPEVQHSLWIIQSHMNAEVA